MQETITTVAKRIMDEHSTMQDQMEESRRMLSLHRSDPESYGFWVRVHHKLIKMQRTEGMRRS